MTGRTATPTDALSPSMLAGIEIVPLYRSEAGDHWTLIHYRRNGTTIIRHVPNVLSGGRASDTPLADFLAPGCTGPEHQAARIWMERAADAR